MHNKVYPPSPHNKATFFFFLSGGYVSGFCVYLHKYPPPSLQQSNLLYLYFIFIFVFMSLGFVSFYIIFLVRGFITWGFGSLGFDPTGVFIPWVFYTTYRIIRKISPGLILVKALFFGLIFEGGLFSGRAYFWDEIRVRRKGGLIIEGYISATITKRIISL